MISKLMARLLDDKDKSRRPKLLLRRYLLLSLAAVVGPVVASVILVMTINSIGRPSASAML